ncbi:LytR/AlgR family response regulator transcription factor [Parafilimonas sp.]|uniref:LytR/AlgR family response regulator transcription factor n=1 Tax=Parafilimonas sp. TaxID=1969739 RepID=UPI003F81C412
MDILIIEDEPNASRQLKEMILLHRPEINIVAEIDNVDDSIAYFSAGKTADLMFVDIHLSDGQAFEIFESVKIFIPVIFTTAYDKYAIKAFEVNSVDYLLKPLSSEMVEKAINKFEKQSSHKNEALSRQQIQNLQQLLSANNIYKENFLIPFKDKLLPVAVKEFAWFEIKNGIVAGKTFSNETILLEERSLDELAEVINPADFYRANRQYLIHKKAIKEISHHFNRKLIVTITPGPALPVIISRERVSHFKEWMSR